jgi:hypothetical protein
MTAFATATMGEDIPARTTSEASGETGKSTKSSQASKTDESGSATTGGSETGSASATASKSTGARNKVRVGGLKAYFGLGLMGVLTGTTYVESLWKFYMRVETLN